MVNGDVLTDLDLAAPVARHDSSGAEGTIALHRAADLSAFGVVPTRGRRAVTAFVEEALARRGPHRPDQRGHLRARASVIDRIALDVPVNVERVTFPAMVADGSLYAFDGGSYWIDAGTPATYLRANLDLLDRIERRDGEPAVHPTAVVTGPWRARGSAPVPRSAMAPRWSDPCSSRGPRGAGASVRGSILGGRPRRSAWCLLDGDVLLGDGYAVADGATLSGGPPPGSDGEGPRHWWRRLHRLHRRRSVGSPRATFVDVIDDLLHGPAGQPARGPGRSVTTLKVHQVDIRRWRRSIDLIAVAQPEVVFHLAAQVDVAGLVARPAFDAAINVLGSAQRARGGRLGGPRRVVLASSGGTIYGEPDPRSSPVKESHPQQPLSPYGVAKRVVTDYLNAYRELSRARAYTSLALANVFGPR